MATLLIPRENYLCSSELNISSCTVAGSDSGFAEDSSDVKRGEDDSTHVSSSSPGQGKRGKGERVLGAPSLRRRAAMTSLEASIASLQNIIAAHQANTVNEQILVKAADIVRQRIYVLNPLTCTVHGVLCDHGHILMKF